MFLFCRQKTGQYHNVNVAIKYFKNVAESKLFGNEIHKFA
jgi:hypothetical protein